MTEDVGSRRDGDGKLPRIALFICSVCYFSSLIFFLKNYAAIEWSFYGYSYGDLPFHEWIMAIFCIGAISLFIPAKIKSPSSLFLVIVYIFLIMPAIAVFLGLYRTESGIYYGPLIITSLSFAAACYFVPYKKWEAGDGFVLHHSVIPALVTLHGLTLIFLFYRFGSIMSFANLDNIYEQRALGAAENFIEGYAQTYSQYVFSLGLITIGLVRKNLPLIIFGLFGTMVNYAITAEKAGAIYPLFIFALFFAMKSKRNIFVSTALIVSLFATMLIFSAIFYQKFGFADFIAWYFGVRSILGPGAFVAYYYDFFSSDNLTYFSHIRGINIFVAPPPAFFNDYRWPSIGLILGEDYLKFSTLNANANFLASDGIASLGALGIPIIIAAFSLFIALVDRVTYGLSATASCSLFLPIALTLTNGSIFTALTSFGGVLWLIIVRYYVGSRVKSVRTISRRTRVA